jgi:hypothetical protein
LGMAFLAAGVFLAEAGLGVFLVADFFTCRGRQQRRGAADTAAGSGHSQQMGGPMQHCLSSTQRTGGFPCTVAA